MRWVKELFLLPFRVVRAFYRGLTGKEAAR